MKNNQSAEKFALIAGELLSAGKYTEALENFNQCLRYAESKSQVLSDAYAGRASAFFKSEQLENCLENIQCAIDTSVCDEKCKSLKAFQVTCLKEKKNISSEKSDDQFIKLSLPAHKKIPFIAECLEVRENDVYGRYIMTTRDLNPGDVVVLEEPFYKVLSAEKRHLRCAICLRQNRLNLFPCAKCPTGE